MIIMLLLLHAAIASTASFVVPAVLLGYALCKSKRNPYTGSRDWPLFSAAREMQQHDKFDKLVASNEHRVLPESDRRVMRANQIFQEALRDIKSMGRRDLCQFKWELKVIDGQYSGCLAGGKVILELKDADMDEHEVASILCHELGHAIARHLADVSALMAPYALFEDKSVMSVILHNAERKADRIGAVLMARIGYDPRACIGLMSRFYQVYSFTHPHPMERAEALMRSKAMRKAMEIYRTNKGLRQPYLFELYEGIPDKFVDMMLPSGSGSLAFRIAFCPPDVL